MELIEGLTNLVGSMMDHSVGCLEKNLVSSANFYRENMGL